MTEVIEHAIVVDDDPVIRAILRSTLAGIGLGVHLAEGGSQALDVAERVKADLIVLDLLMPEMNGLETCRHLRRMESYTDTPIVVLTGHDHAQVEAAAFAAGAAGGTVVAGVDRAVLDSSACTAVSAGTERRALAAASAQVQTDT